MKISIFHCSNMQISTFHVHRQELRTAEWTTETIADTLQPDEVLLRIEQFSFTSNNVSYIITGDRLGYWRFFPAQAEGYGKVPVWGFATVQASAHTSVAVGERFYGYFPMASHLVVQASHVKPHGFVDVMPHRVALPAVYNAYINVGKDEFYNPDTEGFQAVFRPLFTTSFLLDDFVATQHFFDSEQIVLTGASSKTAFSLAFLLQERKKNGGKDIHIIGLTSETNKAFTEQLGCYDTVITYNNLPTLPQTKTVIVDFAGNQNLHFDLQTYWGANLAYHCLVGAVHWDKTNVQKALPTKAFFFFAPEHAQKAMQTWGRDTFQQKLINAWSAFSDEYAPKIQLETVAQQALFVEKYQTIIEGKYPANQALLFAFA